MRHLRKLAILVSATVVISPIVAGQPFTVSVETMTDSVTPGDGEVELFHINVTNTGDTTQQFMIRTETRNNWYSGPYPYRFSLDPGASTVSRLYIQIGTDAIAGRRGIEIHVKNGNGERIVRRPSFRINRDQDLLVDSFSLDNDTYMPGATATARIRVRNVVDREFAENEYRAVVSLDDQEKTVPFKDLDPGEAETVNAEFTLSQYTAGVKTVGARVEDIDGNLVDQESAKIEVRTVESVERQRQQEFHGISTRTVLTASNTGNIPAEDTVVTARVPSYLSHFVSFTTEPTTVDSTGGKATYTWNVGDLAPGDTATVTYRVNYWTPLAIIAVILIAAVLGVRELRRPRIAKKALQKNGKHAVHITVKNRSGTVLDNVVVKDFVPGIATLIEKFDSSPPETIRQGEEGTEIEWKLGRMDPGEERILTYQISPQVEVEETVTLPAAQLAYRTGETEKKRSSHHASADFR
jgi:hypothetical protein